MQVRSIAWRGTAAAIVAFAAVSGVHAGGVEPLGVEVSVQGAPVEADGCTGGDWSLRWRGELPGEGGTVNDILISYSSFDTTHESDAQGPAATLNIKPVVCKDDEGNVVLTSNVAGGDRLVRGVIALKNDPAFRAPFFILELNNAGTCRIGGSMQQELSNFFVTLRTTEMVQLSPALIISRTEMTEGFEKRFQLAGQVIPMSPFCMGHKIVRGDVTMRYKRRDEQPNLTLAGCVNLARGGSTAVQATVTPAGGSLTFDSDPAGMLSLQPQSNAARVTGAAPGRGTLKAQYTFNGRTANASLRASSVAIVSVNDGEPVAPMGLYAVNGKLSSKVYSVPIRTEPADAGDLLIFAAENDAIVSVNTNRNSIAIQPVREGRTIIQAKTLCGEPVGPPIEIEIRTCDEQTQAELERQQEELMRREREIVKRITQLTGDSEFQRAATDIKDDTIILATRTAELIAATLTGAQSAAVKNGTATAVSLQQVEMAQNIWDVSNVINDANNGNINSSLLGAAVVSIGKWQVSALKSAIEAGLAAEKFGQDLGTLAGVIEQLETLEKQHDDARRQVYDVTRRLHQCQKLPPPPPLPPKQDEPKPQPLPVPEPEPQPEIPVPQPGEPVPTPEQPPVPPPGPVDPPRVPGSAALCVRPIEEPVETRDLRALIDATTRYKTVAQRAREVYENFTVSLQTLQQATTLGPDVQIAAVKNFAGPFNAMVQQHYALGEAAQSQQKRFELCTEKLPTQVEHRSTRPAP